MTLLVNNAGIGTGTSALAANAAEMAQREFDTNVLGPLAMTQAFAPILGANGGGAIVNVLSVLAWFSAPQFGAVLRGEGGLVVADELDPPGTASQRTQVLALHVGFMDTDMTAGLDVPKSSPDDVAAQVMDGLEAGEFEVLADDVSRRVRAALSGDLTVLYPALGR